MDRGKLHIYLGGDVARAYSQLTIQYLFGKSRFFCAFPDCKINLLAPATDLDDEKNLAQIAHIVSYSDDGPRADPSMPPEDRNKYPNLILLCAHHHSLVDKQDSTYTVEALRQWKVELETWVETKLSDGMAVFSFTELEAVCDSLVRPNELSSTPIVAVPPQAKMDANALSQAVSFRMMIGLAQAPQVADFIERYAAIDMSYPQRLRAGFAEQYADFVAVGLTGDALFFAMADWAARGAARLDYLPMERWASDAAALAVLCHLFEVCDVFEVPVS